MTFRDLIALHRDALRDRLPAPGPADRHNRDGWPLRVVFTDWASI